MEIIKRKVVRHGPTTLTISLPVSWVKQNKINENMELEVVENGRELKILLHQPKDQFVKKISVGQNEIFTKNHLSDLYRLGYDQLQISYKNPRVLDQINERIIDCIGYEVIEQKDGSCIIKNIAEGKEEEFDNILRKVFLLLVTASSGTYEALNGKQLQRLVEIRAMEQMNNRWTDFCLRIINKGGLNKGRVTSAYTLIQTLERVADEYKYICDAFLNEKRINITKESLDYFNKLNDFLRAFYNFYYNYDPKIDPLLIKKKTQLLEEGKLLLAKKGKQDFILIHHSINLCRRIDEAIGLSRELAL